MSLYRLEIGGETCWVLAHNEEGAVDLAIAHVQAEPRTGEMKRAALIRDQDAHVVVEATVEQLMARARESRKAR